MILNIWHIFIWSLYYGFSHYTLCLVILFYSCVFSDLWQLFQWWHPLYLWGTFILLNVCMKVNYNDIQYLGYLYLKSLLWIQSLTVVFDNTLGICHFEYNMAIISLKASSLILRYTYFISCMHEGKLKWYSICGIYLFESSTLWIHSLTVVFDNVFWFVYI